MQVKDLTNNHGQSVYPWIPARIEQGIASDEDLELWSREVKSGDLLPFETLRNGTVRRVQITGNTPTSWKIVETKLPQE